MMSVMMVWHLQVLAYLCVDDIPDGNAIKQDMRERKKNLHQLALIISLCREL